MNDAGADNRAPGKPGPSVTRFETLDFDVRGFDHEAHVYVAWRYLQEFELLESISRFRTALKNLTSSLGKPDKYHETITWFFMIVVAERATEDAAQDRTAFRRRNADLFQADLALVCAHYTQKRLNSAAAKTKFLLPDLIPGTLHR